MHLSHHSHRARGPLLRKIEIFLTVYIARVKPSFFWEKMSAIFFLQNTALELDQDNGKGKKRKCPLLICKSVKKLPKYNKVNYFGDKCMHSSLEMEKFCN